MELITCDKLSMSYEGATVFEDVSFTVEKGDYLCILGENGSGKSTLVKGILGLKQASAGKITLANLKRSQIGYLPQQNALQKDFPATVREVVLSGCLNGSGFRPFYTKKQKNDAAAIITELHLDEIKKKSFRELSGGQQQRVLIARALCATDELLLLDEPVTGLDPIVTNELYELINHLNKNHGVTVITITHDIGGALRYANKILSMSHGGNFFGTAAEYKQTEMFRSMIGGDENV